MLCYQVKYFPICISDRFLGINSKMQTGQTKGHVHFATAAAASAAWWPSRLRHCSTSHAQNVLALILIWQDWAGPETAFLRQVV